MARLVYREHIPPESFFWSSNAITPFLSKNFDQIFGPILGVSMYVRMYSYFMYRAEGEGGKEETKRLGKQILASSFKVWKQKEN